jgi:hypothetical protein
VNDGLAQWLCSFVLDVSARRSMVQFPHQGVLDINVLNPDFWYTLEVSKNQHRGTVIPMPTDSDQEKAPEKEKKDWVSSRALHPK